MDKIDKEIKELEVELIMSAYHDGWTAEWIRERLDYLRELKKQSGAVSDSDEVES